jgi:hypothetical protein
LNAAKTSKPGKFKVNKNDVKCYNCGKKGHFKGEYRKPIMNETHKNDVHEDSYVALHANTMQMSSETWVVDNEASNHVHPNMFIRLRNA